MKRLLIGLLLPLAVVLAGVVGARSAAASTLTGQRSSLQWPSCTAVVASVVAVVAVQPENRVKAISVDGGTRVGDLAFVSPARIGENGDATTAIAVGATLVNLSDPSGHSFTTNDGGPTYAPCEIHGTCNSPPPPPPPPLSSSGGGCGGPHANALGCNDAPTPTARPGGDTLGSLDDVCMQADLLSLVCRAISLPPGTSIEGIVEGCQSTGWDGIPFLLPSTKQTLGCRYGVVSPGTTTAQEKGALCPDSGGFLGASCDLSNVGWYLSIAVPAKGPSWPDGPFPEGGGGGFIDGRWYSEHALERMAPGTPEVRAVLEARFWARAQQLGLQPGTPEYAAYYRSNFPQARNIPSSVVESQIVKPSSESGVRVVINGQGDVVTVYPGESGVIDVGPDGPDIVPG